MNLLITIYLFGIILIPIIYGLLNRKFRWITREEFDDNVGDCIFSFVMAILCWPALAAAVIIIGFITALGMLFRMLFIPK